MPTLNWLTRDIDIKLAERAPYRLLEPVTDLSHGDQASGNMLIQGDNLEALKALLPFYAGEVKCIYIDPPYNTRSAFEQYDDNLEHAQWLAMMYPRLELLSALLSKDGSIWVSIDDNEGHYLKVIMDEIFGRKNFVTSFIWQKVDSPNENMSRITPDHEYVLCYAANIAKIRFKKRRDPSVLEAFPQKDDTGRRYRDRLLKKNGRNSLRQDRPSMFFGIPAPDGSIVLPIHDDGREARWSAGKGTVFTMLERGEIIWKKRRRGETEVWVPYTREYAPLDPVRPHATILLDVKTSRQAKAHQREVLPGVEVFDTVKPEHLLQRVFEIASEPGDLILDSFLGSGTTAAVAHKMGRRYIGIEMGEHAVSHCVPRLKRVVEGEQGGVSQEVGWNGGSGFRFYRLGEAVFDAEGRIASNIRFPTLAAHVWFSETGLPLSRPVDSPFLGVHDDTGYYLLYNGILRDKSSDGGNVLTHAILRSLPPFAGRKVIYGAGCRLTASTLADHGIAFKQTPYDIKAR